MVQLGRTPVHTGKDEQEKEIERNHSFVSWRDFRWFIFPCENCLLCYFYLCNYTKMWAEKKTLGSSNLYTQEKRH